MDDELKFAIEQSIDTATGLTFQVQNVRLCGGGCINDAIILQGLHQHYFVKLNIAARLGMFIAEAAGLRTMYETKTIRVPKPIVYGCFGNTSYLVLEALEFGGPKDWKQMGRQMAKLHRNVADRFGWERDNTIGSTIQRNSWTSDWATFFRENRLGFQFELAQQNGYYFEQSETLLESVTAILAGHKPDPSLLHGDLWSGNAGFLADGQPVIYDPACYFGDRETDLAFSEFFGGFSSDFYRGYQSEWPLSKGYEQRKTLYNLYHVLNHTNLFGGSYAGRAQQMIKQYTSLL